MSDSFELSISGIDEAIDGFRKLPEEIAAEHLPKALEAGGAVLFEAVASRIPPRPANYHGKDDLELRGALVSDLTTGATGGQIRIGFPTLQQGKVAMWLEYGHRMVGRNGAEEGNVQAYPFFRPAFDASSDAAIAAATDALLDGIGS